MKNEIIIEGKIFISARQAAEITKYATDYIGQLSRAGKINARMIGRTWFVDQQSLLNYKNHIDPESSIPNNYQISDLQNPHSSPSQTNQNVPASQSAQTGLTYLSDDRELLPNLNKKIPVEAQSIPPIKKSAEKSIFNKTISAIRESGSAIQKSGLELQNSLPSLWPHARNALTLGIVLAFIVFGATISSHPDRAVRAMARVADGLGYGWMKGADILESSSRKMSGLTAYDIEIFADKTDDFVRSSARKSVNAYVAFLINTTDTVYLTLSSFQNNIYSLAENIFERTKSSTVATAGTSLESARSAIETTVSNGFDFLASLRGRAVVSIRKFLGIKDGSGLAVSEDNRTSTTTIIVRNITSSPFAQSVSNPSFTTVINNIDEALLGRVSYLERQFYGLQNAQPFQYSNIGANVSQAIDNIDLSNITGATITGATITGSYFSGSADLTGNVSLSGQLNVSGTGTSTLAGDTAFDTNVLYIDSINNRVGVGTSSPTDTLSVAGPIFLGNISAPSNSANRLYATAGDLYFAGSLIGGGTTGNWTTDGTHVWRSSGNVGIGTTTPGSILSVAGVGNFSGSGSTLYSTLTLPSLTATSSLTLSGVAINSLLSTNSSGVVTATSTPTFGNFNATSTSATSTIAGGLAIETSGFVYDYQTNRVGIGTAAPSTKLEIADATPTLTIKDTTTSISTGGTYGNLDFYSSDTNFVGVVSRIRSKTNDSNGGSDGELSFWTLAGGGSLSEKMRLTTDGKLGLGTTTPNWQLQQAATRPFHVLSDTSAGTNAKHWFTSSQGGNFYIGTSSDALNATTTLLTINTAGFVGIATTSPATLLAVGGHCVTADTRLRRRRKKKGAKDKKEDDYDYDYDEVMIKDVKEGDEIASLDEKTGAIVWSRVNALLDMGVKPIYKFTTATGKTIRTTGEHPYLVKTRMNADKEKKNSDLWAGATLIRSIIARAVSLSSAFVDNAVATAKDGSWRKAGTIKEGAEIAIVSEDGRASVWDKVVKIEMLPDEQVYDIEVEGTHNFVGNDIIAHNTYITGGLGVGKATTTSGALDVSGSGVFGNILSASVFTATSTTATSTFAGGLAIETSGFVYDYSTNNVGIGTASPSYKLNIVGPSVSSGAYSNVALFEGLGSATNMGVLEFKSLRDDPNTNGRNFALQVWQRGSVGTTAKNLLLQPDGGNVGIGTTTPNWQLQQAATRPFHVLSDTSAAANLKHWFMSSQGGNFYLGTSSDSYSTTTMPSITITSNNLVGIGTTSPSSYATLTVGGVTESLSFIATSTTATSTFAGGITVGPSSEYVFDHIGNALNINSPGVFTGALNIARGGNTYNINLTDSSAILRFNSSGGNINMSGGGSLDGSGTMTFGPTSANSAVFKTNNTTRMTLDSSGNLGIGTTTPQYKLQVAGVTPVFTLSDTNSGTDTKHWFQTSNAGKFSIGTTSDTFTATTTLLTLSTNGFLGVGTTTPNWQLQQAATRPFHVLSDTSAGTNAKHWFTSSQGGNFYIGTSSDALNATTTLLTIANSGKVGIGTAAPSSALHVVSKATSEAGLIVTGGSTVNSHVDSGQVQIGTTVNFARLGYAAVTGTFYIDNTYNNDNSDIRFRSKIAGTAVDTLIIKGSGNLGLGTTTPQYKLQVAGVTPVLTLSDTNGGTDAKHWFQTSNAGKFSIGTTSDTFAATTTLLTLSTNGFLGVGTTTPNWQLQTASTRPFSVLSDTSAGANLKHWFTTSQGGNFYLGTSSDIYATTTVPSITITSNGLVGIASTSPSAYAILTAGGAIEGWNFIATSTTATSTFAGGLNVGNGALMYDFSQGLTSIDNLQIGATSFDTDAGILSWADMPVTSNAAAYTDESYTAQIDGNPILTVYAQSNGSGDIMNPRVGIGTTTPSYFLHLQLGDGITNATSTVLALDHISTTTAPTAGIGAGLLFRNMNAASSTIETASIIGLLSTVTAGSEDGELAFLTKSAGGALSERLRINKNGLVGVGTTTPWAKFSITATSTEVVPLFAVSTSTASATTTVLVVDANGKLGLATTSPWRTLSVVGTVALNGLTATPSTQDAVCIDAVTNEITTNTSQPTCTVSSARFKNNISTLNTSALDSVTKFRPVSFKYNGGDSSEHIGLIAEEVNLIEPRLVAYEADGVTPRGVRYEEMTALLIKAIQEQNARLDNIASSTQALASSLPEKIISTVQSWLESVGVGIKHGLVSLQGLFTQSLTVGTKEKPSGITIYDEATGAPYCLKILNGSTQTTAGECLNVAVATSTIATPTNTNNTAAVLNATTNTNNNQTNTPAIDTASSTQTTSTTTTSIVETFTATTTPNTSTTTTTSSSGGGSSGASPEPTTATIPAPNPEAATGQTINTEPVINNQSPATDSQSPTTNDQSSITNDQNPATSNDSPSSTPAPESSSTASSGQTSSESSVTTPSAPAESVSAPAPVSTPASEPAPVQGPAGEGN
ncbi:MAG: hypothetical protein A3B11_02050 [Candidatus Taylorbacteria bacterium RIFCSPLOWO2_01_FULL_44_26]|uniref:Peptidase S74 domain-containing protein n=1 Tax=Candidatus Taylorbacteria bacterium RIFCSPLOWO2_01_FULL_44_26 TaxID=1802318 RepID=A0A1G2N638_9BACT|nr:MAG: hypothetical protein A3B11_02050 [Candidatus Taylorbacteria bacterium RIFCSPLOWO2_01_FULL_44_26]